MFSEEVLVFIGEHIVKSCSNSPLLPFFNFYHTQRGGKVSPHLKIESKHIAGALSYLWSLVLGGKKNVLKFVPEEILNFLKDQALEGKHIILF